VTAILVSDLAVDDHHPDAFGLLLGLLVRREVADGAGDGRIAIAAAKKYGIKAVGIDIDPERIREATENARKAGVTNLVQFRQEDLFKADFRDATVVTLYLLPDLNVKLRPRLWNELKPGTRIVSHQFDMGKWKPEKTLESDGRTIYFWTVPEKNKRPKL
jgi:ribosomal protein L11 methylase PrmA